jgi:glutamate racemase
MSINELENSKQNFDQRPIGVFDSGLGGISVLKQLVSSFPNEDFIYIGDTARLPYGNKSSETIRKYTEQIMNALLQQNVKALVVACNSASTTISETTWKDIPVYDVIRPGAKLSVNTSQNQRIGLLGTRATIASGAYERQIKLMNPESEIFAQACPLFVPLVEEGWTEDPITNLVVYRYIQPLLQNDVDTVILGCTHYPFLNSALRKTLGNHIALVDSGTAVSQQLDLDFKSQKLIANSNKNTGQLKIGLTDFSVHSKHLCENFLSPIISTEIYALDL